MPLKAGHFGLRRRLDRAQRDVARRGHVDEEGELPETAIDIRADNVVDPFKRTRTLMTTTTMTTITTTRRSSSQKDLVEKTAKAAVDRIEELSEDIGAYLDNARWQLPRLNRLRHLQDDSLISLGRSLGEQAAKIGDRTFFLWRGRAFTYADANKRVDAVVMGLIACSVKPGMRVGVMMKSRPSHHNGRRRVQPPRRSRGAAVSRDDRRRVAPRASRLGEPKLLILDPVQRRAHAMLRPGSRSSRSAASAIEATCNAAKNVSHA